MIKSLKIEDVTRSICYAELKEWIISVSENEIPEDVITEAVNLYNKMIFYFSSFVAAPNKDYSNYISFKDELDIYLFDKTALAGTVLNT